MVARAAILLILLLAGCAPPPREPSPSPSPSPFPLPPSPSPSATIDAEIRRGCYHCLERAFHTATGADLREDAYQAALLLVLRAKELGLDWAPWLSEAQQALPAPEWAVYLDVVKAASVDPLSGDRDLLLADEVQRRRPRDVFEGWQAALETGPGRPVVRAYLGLANACRRLQPQAEPRDRLIAGVTARFGDVPLLMYRLALCGADDARERMHALRAADPEFVDADFELGRMAVQNQVQPDYEEGLRRFRAARAAFPDSLVIPSLIAGIHEAREDWAEALQTYEEVLAVVPTHRDAMLGRVVTLSHLGRADDAIATATRLLDLGNWFIGQAYYWRAWTEFQLKQIAAARADVDRAKTLMVNPSVFVLSGLVSWVEKRLEPAQGEFQNALDMDYGQCDAAFYLGGVRVEQRSWPEGLAAYQHSQQCFELSITVRREAIARLSVTPEAEAANVREIASHRRAIADSQKRVAESAQNVAALQRFLDTAR
jgi:tetratricopeptide (TPR) repeat protein